MTTKEKEEFEKGFSKFLSEGDQIVMLEGEVDEFKEWIISKIEEAEKRGHAKGVRLERRRWNHSLEDLRERDLNGI